jgi:hypothetical protein
MHVPWTDEEIASLNAALTLIFPDRVAPQNSTKDNHGPEDIRNLPD